MKVRTIFITGVQSNLWGMETHNGTDVKRIAFQGSIESMRNGNPKPQLYAMTAKMVQSNLWGMETAVIHANAHPILKFNRIYEEWKPVFRLAFVSRFVSFNRIYEEWKHFCSASGGPPSLCSIESMRNGNTASMTRISQARRSSIESMRNGNQQTTNAR